MPVLEYFIENNPRYKSYNVVPDEETELLSAAQAVAEVSGSRAGVQVAQEGYGLNYSGDNARLRGEIPSLRFTPFKQAVQQLYRWYAENKNILQRELLLRDK